MYTVCVIVFCKQKQNWKVFSSRLRVNTLKKYDSEIFSYITQKISTIENVYCNNFYDKKEFVLPPRKARGQKMVEVSDVVVCLVLVSIIIDYTFLRS